MYLPQLATSCKKLLIMIFHRKGDRTHYLGGSRGGVVGAGAAWGQPGGRDGADESTGGSTDRARTPRCAAARAGPARTTTRRGGGRPGDDEEGRRAGDDLEGGHGRAPAGEERGVARGRASRGGKKKSGRRGDVDLNWTAPKGVICWGVLG